MVTNSQEVVRQQHLREILGKKEGRKKDNSIYEKFWERKKAEKCLLRTS